MDTLCMEAVGLTAQEDSKYIHVGYQIYITKKITEYVPYFRQCLHPLKYVSVIHIR